MSRLLMLLAIVLSFGPLLARAEDEPPEDSIQVEVRGTLERSESSGQRSDSVV